MFLHYRCCLQDRRSQIIISHTHTHESLTSNLLSGTEQLSARWLLASTRVCIYLVKHIFHTWWWDLNLWCLQVSYHTFTGHGLCLFNSFLELNPIETVHAGTFGLVFSGFEIWNWSSIDEWDLVWDVWKTQQRDLQIHTQNRLNKNEMVFHFYTTNDSQQCEGDSLW